MRSNEGTIPGNAAHSNLEQSASNGKTMSDAPAPFNNLTTTPSHCVLDIGIHAHPESTREMVSAVSSTESVPLPCHTSKGFISKILHLVGSVVIFVFIVITTVTSLGLPYWYYRAYRFKPSHHREHEAPPTQQQSILEQWFLALKRLRSQWKAVFTLSVGVLPVVLPMLGAYPIPKCSWPFLLSAVALLSGLTTLVVTTLYRCHADAFRHESTSRIWREASQSSWGTPLTKWFWVFVSLPTIWLLYFMCALVTSIIFVVWEQAFTEKSTGDMCLSWHVHTFRATLLTLVCTALMHLIFIVSVLLLHFEW